MSRELKTDKVQKVAKFLGLSPLKVRQILLSDRKKPIDRISNITTIQEAEKAYNESPEGSKAEKLALEKLYRLI